MKFLISIALLMSSFMVFAGGKTTEVFTLDHQMAPTCQKKITANLRFEKGIVKIETSLKENTITITYDNEKTNTEQIIKAFKKIKFNAFVVKPESESRAEDNNK